MVPTAKNLLTLLSNNDVTFFIPPYQRNYEWDDSQCKVFWEDVIKTAKTNEGGTHTEHFFGSVTYFQDEGVFGEPTKLILIDGQQRITTTMLFLAALRDIIADSSQKEYINSRYLKNNNSIDETEYKIKLKQVESDWSAYKKIILSEDLSTEDKLSAVWHNYNFFKTKINSFIKENADYNLSKLIEHGLDKFSVITIELQPKQNSWENPQEIFESMNSIGKPLSLADLVRNYLLLGLDAETQNKYYHQYWMKIEKTVPKQISNFIRDYMQDVTAKPYRQASENNYKELYSLFKKIFANEDAENLLYNLSKYSEYYSYISLSKSSGSVAVDKVLDDLKQVNVSTSYSFIMMLIAEWKKGAFFDYDLVNILEAFKVYNYRRRILGITQNENKTFPTLVDKIQLLIKAKDKKREMFQILSKQENSMRLPNDVEMTREMETMNFYSFKYCKYFLALVEENLTRSRPDLSDSHLQIEHIMPQKLNEQWKKSLGDDYEQIQQTYINSIGNLTLIRHNQELGNKSFNEKKDTYTNYSGLQIAKTMITDKNDWNENTIKDRSIWLIKYILEKIVPIPSEMVRTNNFVPKEGKHLSFLELQLIGSTIYFMNDPSITAKVVSDVEVEFEGKKWRLSPLTREIFTRKGTVNRSGTYNGSQFWGFDGMRISDIL
ncbi:DUF262 domain-containing protein [Holdemanella porci]|uniref:DUF262 domain-containing protein n=1 Tax=Holdemanella porci TaxID=2652276 RepID=UPI003AB6C950